MRSVQAYGVVQRRVDVHAALSTPVTLDTGYNFSKGLTLRARRRVSEAPVETSRSAGGPALIRRVASPVKRPNVMA
ncbi:hypothetical protein EVAR_56282_1 [Eumeta japonica]|uniref:Uncharacterized protein n=1 Tax=Eumeta variegata TaxID=151549 RepID=A0A4C1YF25_EUMVA|nr:hypothetical protein EVAR_56282_1 [Eumeta japonica]